MSSDTNHRGTFAMVSVALGVLDKEESTASLSNFPSRGQVHLFGLWLIHLFFGLVGYFFDVGRRKNNRNRRAGT